MGETVHNLVAPLVLFLSFDDGLANIPIQKNQLTVDRIRRAKLGGSDPIFEISQQCGIASRKHSQMAAITTSGLGQLSRCISIRHAKNPLIDPKQVIVQMAAS
jgi:hypothetical protein